MSFAKLIIRALLTLHKDGTDFYIIGEKKKSQKPIKQVELGSFVGQNCVYDQSDTTHQTKLV